MKKDDSAINFAMSLNNGNVDDDIVSHIKCIREALAVMEKNVDNDNYRGAALIAELITARACLIRMDCNIITYLKNDILEKGK